LEDVVPVWAVLDFSLAPILERELLLVKVSVSPEDHKGKADPYHSTSTSAVDAHLKRQAITELTNLFGGKIIDVSLTQCAIELCSESHRVDSFIHMLKPFGILEASRSGVMAISKGSNDGRSLLPDIKEEQLHVDATQLPPG